MAKKLQKYLVVSKKCLTFALAFENNALVNSEPTGRMKFSKRMEFNP